MSRSVALVGRITHKRVFRYRQSQGYGLGDTRLYRTVQGSPTTLTLAPEPSGSLCARGERCGPTGDPYELEITGGAVGPAYLDCPVQSLRRFVSPELRIPTRAFVGYPGVEPFPPSTSKARKAPWYYCSEVVYGTYAFVLTVFGVCQVNLRFDMLSTKGLCVRVLAATALVALPLTSIAAPTYRLRTMVSLPPHSTCNQDRSAIVLGPALEPFDLLAGSTITNVGDSLVMPAAHVVKQNVHRVPDDFMGVWPGTAVTGFYPPGLDENGVNAIYASGYNGDRAVPMAAQAAFTAAYAAAAARPATAIVAGDLSVNRPLAVLRQGDRYPLGTLPPGVYKSRGTLGIGAGNLTLDGMGNSRSVFIFQVATAFTTTANGELGGNVILTNGASPCNVYWQVGSSATLGGASFYGTLLASSSITLNATTVTGRVLAGAGAVTIPVAGGTSITNPGGQ